MSAADRVVLELMAAPLGVALRAQALSDAAQQSRRRLVAAGEGKRGRLRQDLHDGLGPALTGIGFRADAVMNLTDDPARSLAAEIRAIVDTAIADVRRLINQLHPSALDDVGLASGLSTTAMAARLAVTPKTANLSTVFGKLGVADRSEAALFARGALRRGRGPGGFGG